jgi:2,4-dienoyl-CoA reductase-like NADH-dependent reductase (Old Yellow Enzyme family)
MNALSKLKIKKINLANRITVASMCQYSAKNGNPTLWHYGHLQQLANSGAGMLMLESTAVSSEGRITEKDLMLSNKKNENKLKKLFAHIRLINDIPIGLQISHAGRKGSAEVPWIKSNSSIKNKNRKWTTYAPSSIKKGKNWPIPKSLSITQIETIKKKFKEAAIRAKNIGFDCLEIHMAHGYLLHQFFSPVSNKRNDKYGGTLENRCRLLVDIIKEIKKIWPNNKVLGARVTGQDWLKNGSNLDDCVYLVKKMKKIGIDYVCVSSGGIVKKTNILFKPGYQVHLAREIKKRTGIITRTAGMINNLNQANKIIKSKSADLINIARHFIKYPTWLLNILSKEETTKSNIPGQYRRCI